MVNGEHGVFFVCVCVWYFSHASMGNLRSILRSRYMIVEQSGVIIVCITIVADAQLFARSFSLGNFESISLFHHVYDLPHLTFSLSHFSILGDILKCSLAIYLHILFKLTFLITTLFVENTTFFCQQWSYDVFPFVHLPEQYRIT